MSATSGGSGEKAATLDFTGERFTPECVREIWYEHWHRYAFARRFAAGRRGLDAACGEGYGSAMLAGAAASVLGVDIADAAIAHARSRYGAVGNLRFEQGDCTALACAPGSFDLVVSFETLEHVAAQEALIGGFARALAPGGMLLVSSPDKRNYSDKNGFRNEFHVRELYRDELLDLLGRHFAHVRLYAQKLLFQSAIWALDERGGAVDASVSAGGAVASGLVYEPMYYVAVCSAQPPGDLPQLSLFGDAEESVYQHYNSEIRKSIAAGRRIAELEAQLAAATREHAASPGAEPDPAAGSPWRRWLRRRR